MLRTIGTWLPTILLVALFVAAVALGATGIEWVVILALVAAQVLMLVVPRLARWVGEKAA